MGLGGRALHTPRVLSVLPDACMPPDPPPVLESAILSIPIVIPVKHPFWVSLENLYMELYYFTAFRSVRQIPDQLRELMREVIKFGRYSLLALPGFYWGKFDRNLRSQISVT